MGVLRRSKSPETRRENTRVLAYRKAPADLNTVEGLEICVVIYSFMLEATPGLLEQCSSVLGNHVVPESEAQAAACMQEPGPCSYSQPQNTLI